MSSVQCPVSSVYGVDCFVLGLLGKVHSVQCIVYKVWGIESRVLGIGYEEQ